MLFSPVPRGQQAASLHSLVSPNRRTRGASPARGVSPPAPLSSGLRPRLPPRGSSPMHISPSPGHMRHKAPVRLMTQVNAASAVASANPLLAVQPVGLCSRSQSPNRTPPRQVLSARGSLPPGPVAKPRQKLLQCHTPLRQVTPTPGLRICSYQSPVQVRHDGDRIIIGPTQGSAVGRRALSPPHSFSVARAPSAVAVAHSTAPQGAQSGITAGSGQIVPPGLAQRASASPMRNKSPLRSSQRISNQIGTEMCRVQHATQAPPMKQHNVKDCHVAPIAAKEPICLNSRDQDDFPTPHRNSSKRYVKEEMAELRTEFEGRAVNFFHMLKAMQDAQGGARPGKGIHTRSSSMDTESVGNIWETSMDPSVFAGTSEALGASRSLGLSENWTAKDRTRLNISSEDAGLSISLGSFEMVMRRSPRSLGQPSPIVSQVVEGTALVCTQEVQVFASCTSWDLLGTYSPGRHVTAAGPPQQCGEHVMIPIMPSGAIDVLCLMVATRLPGPDEYKTGPIRSLGPTLLSSSADCFDDYSQSYTQSMTASLSPSLGPKRLPKVFGKDNFSDAFLQPDDLKLTAADSDSGDLTWL